MIFRCGETVKGDGRESVLFLWCYVKRNFHAFSIASFAAFAKHPSLYVMELIIYWLPIDPSLWRANPASVRHQRIALIFAIVFSVHIVTRDETRIRRAAVPVQALPSVAVPRLIWNRYISAPFMTLTKLLRWTCS